MLLLFPRRPYEVTIGAKRFLRAVLPPVALLEHALHDGKVVPGADMELLRLVYLVQIRSSGGGGGILI